MATGSELVTGAAGDCTAPTFNLESVMTCDICDRKTTNLPVIGVQGETVQCGGCLDCCEECGDVTENGAQVCALCLRGCLECGGIGVIEVCFNGDPLAAADGRP